MSIEITHFRMSQIFENRQFLKIFLVCITFGNCSSLNSNVFNQFFWRSKCTQNYYREQLFSLSDFL
jgi:hypothetical protein